MRLFWMNVPQPLEVAVGACRSHFLLAAALSALINVLYLAPTIYMMRVYDRVVPTGGTQTLVWITVIVGLAIATLTALDGVRTQVLMRTGLRLNRLLSAEILDRLMARTRSVTGAPSTAQAMHEFDALRQALGGPAVSALFDAPALQERNLPILRGRLTRISADSFEDGRSGMRYFQFAAIVPPGELAKLDLIRRGGALKAGLPAQVLIPLRKRTAPDYLVEPLTQSPWIAGREH